MPAAIRCPGGVGGGSGQVEGRAKGVGGALHLFEGRVSGGADGAQVGRRGQRAPTAGVVRSCRVMTEILAGRGPRPDGRGGIALV